MEKLSYGQLTENLIEIAWVFQNCVGKYPQLADIDSITWKQEFVAWANEFENLYPNPEYWDDNDYPEAIEQFAERKIQEFGDAGPKTRFSVVDVDCPSGRDLFSIWDSQRGHHYQDCDGDVVYFVNRKQAEEWAADLEAWSGLSPAEQDALFEAERKAYRAQVILGLTADQLRIVGAFAVAGWPFWPTERNPIYFGAAEDYPLVFKTWGDAYEFIDEALLKDAPGLREEVQKVLHPKK